MEQTTEIKTEENISLDNINETIKEIVANQYGAIRNDFETLKTQIDSIKDTIAQQQRERKETKKSLIASTVSGDNLATNAYTLHNLPDACQEMEDRKDGEHFDNEKFGQASATNLQSMERIKKENTFGSFVYRFIESSTLHGFPRLVDSTTWVRVLWIIAMTGAVTALSIQLVGLTKDYLAYSVTTDVGVKQGGMAFPAITVCNKRRFLASRLSSLPLVKNLTGGIYDVSDSWLLAEVLPLNNILAEILTRHYNDLTPEDHSQLGANMDDTIAVLTFPGKVKAKVEVFPYHGSCYSIQSSPGTTFMMVAFNLHVSDSVDTTDKMDQEPGITIVAKGNALAYPTYHPFHGIETSQGVQTLSEISYDEISRLNGSYGQCQDNEDGYFTKTGIAYEQQACINECEFKNIASKCQCLYKESWYYPFWLKERLGKSVFPNCDIDNATHERCMLKAYRDQESCDCKPSCHMKLFRQINQRSIDLGDCVQNPSLIICKLVRQWAPENITKEWLQTNIAAAKIMLTKQPYKIYTQQPAYPFLHFLSDIGGTMGFYLGASLLTYFELVHLSVSGGLFVFNRIKRTCW